MGIRQKVQCFSIVLAMFFIASCAANVNRGYLKDDTVSRIKPGVTTKEEVLKELGSPSSESSFGDKTWYYVSTIRQTRSVLSPQIVDQHTKEIVFGSDDVVSSVKEYTLADSKEVKISTRVTPTEGQHLGFFEQIFSNLGRFNKKDGATASGMRGRNSTGSNPTGYPGR